MRVGMVLLLCGSVLAADSVGWRGDGTGVFPDAKPPRSWEAMSPNVVWKTEVGESYSSPVVVGDRVLVTAEPDLLLCLDRKSGKVLWKQPTRFEDLPVSEKIEPPKKPATSCGYTTPTPVSDGKRVWVVLGTGLVGCYDLDGKRRWVRYLGNERPLPYGRSASPLLVEGRLIVSISSLKALDADTGKTLWNCEKIREKYGSPAVAHIGKEAMIVTPGGEVVRAQDGKVLAEELGRCSNATPLCIGRTIYYFDEEAIAVELPEKVTEPLKTRKLWTVDLGGEFFASPILHQGLLYSINRGGTFYALDAKEGKVVIEKDLRLPRAPRPAVAPTFYPSPVLAGEMLLLSHNGGGSAWLAPGRTFKEMARNVLDAGAAGTPAVAGKQVFLRGGAYLYCVEAK